MKGAALSRYGSCLGFGRAMGWNRNKAYRILNGKQTPTLEEVRHITRTMELTGEEILAIFFPEKGQGPAERAASPLK